MRVLVLDDESEGRGVEGVVSDVCPKQVSPLKLELSGFLRDGSTDAHF